MGNPGVHLTVHLSLTVDWYYYAPSLEVFKAKWDWAFEQPGLGEDVLAHGWGVGIR